MSTLSLRKKLLRSRHQQAGQSRSTLRKIRKYAPWVAAICVGAYLPPKVMSSLWNFDADGNWNNVANWNGGIPNTGVPVADFTLNFTANRTISLVGPPSISPTVGTVRFNDTSPSSTLTILSDANTNLFIKSTSGNQATFDVSKGNTLLLQSSVALTNPISSVVLANIGGDTSGLNKIGNGLLSINGTATYNGPTTLTQGILVAAKLANGGSDSSIGQSTKVAASLVFNGGTLRYVSPVATTPAITDRSFTLGPINAATGTSGTIDSSSTFNGAASLVFGTNFTVVSTPILPAGTNVNLLVGAGPGSTIGSTSDGDRKLTLRGTNVGANTNLPIGPNEIQATITDFGNPNGSANGFHTSVEKIDTGTWRLSAALMPINSGNGNDGMPWTAVYDGTNAATAATWLGNLAYGNTYTGATTIERGTLQIEFAPLPIAQAKTNNFFYVGSTSVLEKHMGVINPKSTLQLGSPSGSGLPGGGTLELLGGSVQRQLPPDPNPLFPGKVYVNYSGAIQDFNNVVINSGANTINRLAYGGTAPNGTTNSEYVFVPDANKIVHNPGGTLRITADSLLKIGYPAPNYVNGIFNGWMHRDDNWATPVDVDTLVNQSNLSPNYHSILTLNSFGSYTGANDSNGATVLIPSSNVIQNSLFTAQFSAGTAGSAGNQRYINSLKFDLALASNFPNKQFTISDGDDPSQLDYPSPRTTMAIATGGLLAASGNAITQILGGAITSGSGDFSIDTTDPQNPVFINRGGGTLGQSEIFAIIRSGAPLYLSSAIVDYHQNPIFGSEVLNVGLTKSGTGTLILTDASSTGLKGAAKSNFSGDTYVNEGILAIRADSALGKTIDSTDFTVDPDTGFDVPPNYGADGTHGQTYLLGASSILDFQAVRYTLPERINVNQGEIQATIGRSTFAGRINNLNEETKVVLRIGTYLELNGSPGSTTDGSGTNGEALRGVGGFQKLGAGLLVVNGAVVIGVDANNNPSTSEFPGSGDLQLDAGNSSWNGPINITNGSINVTAGQHSFNGLISISNGHLTNANALVAFTKPGQNFTVELQQSGASAQTLFGNLNQLAADGSQVYTGPITVGTITAGAFNAGGGITILGSIDFGTSTTPNPVDLTRGTLAQISTVNVGVIPTTRFFGAVTLGANGTTTLYHNTFFNDALTLGFAGLAGPPVVPATTMNLVTVGIGHTTFNGAVTLVNNSTLNLTDSSFTLPYTQSAGSLTLNGLNTFNKNTSGTILPALTFVGGTFTETGTRRSVGVYGVRDTFNGDLTIAPPAALASTLSVTFSGNNDVEGNINITGNALLPGVTLQRADVTFANAQTLGKTSPSTIGSLIVTGGQVTIASSSALGVGNNINPGTAAAPGGVVLQGEKTVFNLLRGVATAANEDITLNPSSTAYMSGVALTSYGSNYPNSAQTVTIGGGGASVNAGGTATLGGTGTQNPLLSVTLTNVGTGYNVQQSGLPTFSTTSAGNASFAPVFGSTVIRAVDQHAVLGGSIILNNVTAGRLNIGVPMISVGTDDSLQITGDIVGVPNITLANTTIYTAVGSTPAGQLNGRFLTTALLGGGTLNSSGGIIILSGQVKDTPSGSTAVGAPGTASNVLNTEWVGSNDLNIQVEKPWNANGLIQLAQGVMRYTNPTPSANFFANSAPNFALSVPSTSFGHASVGYNSIVGNGIQTAAFFLTQPGQVFNAPAFSVYLGNSNKIANDGSSTGFVVIGGENTSGTVTYGTHGGTTGGTISLDVDTAATLAAQRDLRLFANAGGTVDVQYSFVKTVTGTGTGKISIDKVGDGTVWLSGAATTALPAGVPSTLDKAYVLGGVLELRNFGTLTAQRIGTTTQLTLGGGTLRLFTGAATGSTAATGNITQTATGNVTIRNGLSQVQVQTGGQFTSTLALGSSGTAVTRNVAGTVRFAVTGSGAAITLNAANNAGLGNRTVVTPIYWSSYGTNLDPTSNLAATNFPYPDVTGNAIPGLILPFTGAVANDNLSSFAVNTPNIDEVAGFTNQLTSGFTTFNSVRFTGNATVAGAGNLDLRGQSIVMGNGTTNPGAILLASNAQGNNRVISNGTLTSVGSLDIILQNWGGDGTTAPKLTVSAVLANNGANENPLTIVGDGTTVLTGANTFKGNVYLSGGTLEVASAAPLGSPSANPAVFKNLFLDGGTLHTTGDFTWDTRNIVVYGDRNTIQVDAGKTFTLIGNGSAGGIQTQSPEVLNDNTIAYGSANSAVASGTANIFSGDLVFSGGGTFLQVRDNVANTNAGQLFVQGNTRLAFEGNNFGWLGNNLSWMDGTTVGGGGTLELRPTVNSSGASTVGEWLHISGAGQSGAGGALVMKRPSAVINSIFVNAAAALTDHTLSWTGPVTMDGNTTIFVDDSPEITVAGAVGQLTFDDNLFDGGTNFTLTKAGDGILRFNNGRIQNLGSILVSKGELRFEGGILGTIGSAANMTANGLLHTGSALAPAESFNNFTSGTNSIVVGTGATSAFATGGRLAFVDVRGTHNADITLNNGFLFVQSPDAPLQGVNFAGDFNLIGSSAANAIEAIYTNRVNPVVMFGAFNGNGGLTKFGNNELDFVNPNSSFTGEILVARGGGSIASPGVGLYDGGRFTGVTSIRLTNDGSFFLDNRHSLDADPNNNNQNNRLNVNAAINLSSASRFRLLGNGSASTNEAVGVLNVHAGSNAVTFDPTSALQNLGMSFQNYTRDAGGVVNFKVLKTGVDFGTGADIFGNPETTGAATITVRGDLAPSLFVGGNGQNRFGDPLNPDPQFADPQSTSIVVGAFGGGVARNYSTLPANTSVALSLVNNDEAFAARGMMTIQKVDNGQGGFTNYLRPLQSTEYLNATRVGIRVTDTYDFDSLFSRGAEDPFNPGVFPDVANGYNKNVRLIGGFGPSTSALAETNFATEKFYLFDQRDDSRLQDSLYRVLDNITFNSLTFAQQTSEIVDKGGNRLILEISPDKTLTIGSGMILHAGLGIIGAAAPNVNFNSTQSAYIRGGTLNFGVQEGIIQNVAAGLNETTGLFSGSNRLLVSSPIANLNIGPSDLTISSSIAGSGGVTKSGPSSVNFSGANTYSGTTNVVEGILRLENNQALGNSHLVIVSGTGELRMQRGIVVGDPAAPHALQVKFSNVAQTASFRAEAGNNLFYGDVVIDTLNAAGDRFVTAANPYDVSIINGTGASFTFGGDIYGNNTAGGAINPLNDVQRGRQARIVNFNNASPLSSGVPTGGVFKINGSFRDLPTGAVSSFVQSDNEEQVLRAAFTGTSNSNVFISSKWDAAGSILLRQGAIHLTAGLPGQPVTDFFTVAASRAINPFNVQAHPIIGDQAGLSGDVLLGLSTAGQVFNSPTLQIINGSTTSNVTLAAENTSGTVSFFAPSASAAASTQFNDATLRISSWDRNVRLFAAPGGTMQIFGKITDPVATNNGSITKVGGGTVILSGMDGATAGYVNGTSNVNDFDKGILIGAGRLVLDSNVASNTAVANIYGAAPTPLSMGGGKLEIRGDTDNGVRALDTWQGTITFRAGAAEIALVPNNGGITLTLGTAAATTSRAAGATVNFVTSGSGGVINYLSTTSGLTGVNPGVGILAPWATFGTQPGFATDFAATTDAARGLSALPLASYTTLNSPSGFNAGQFANEGSAGFDTSVLSNSVRLIRFQAPAVASVVNIRTSGLTLGIGSNTFDEGAILVPSGTTALKTITSTDLTNGTLQVNGGKELYLLNYGTGGLKVNAPIVGTNPIVLSGPGTTTLGRNRQTGTVYLNEGVTSVDKLNFEAQTFGVAVATAGQTVFTLSDVTNIRTGSAVVSSTGASLGTVLNVNGTSGSAGQITVSTGAPVGTNLLTITPTTPVTINLNLAAAANGTNGLVFQNTSASPGVQPNVAGLAIGAAVIGTGVPIGTIVTGISVSSVVNAPNTTWTETVTFSQSVTNSQNVTFGLPNGLGLATSASTGLVMNGGTLQYTGGTVLTDRNVSVGDGGATFEVTQAATTMQIGTLVTTASLGGPSGNPNGGGLTKIGPGTLIVSGAAGANTYTGLTDVKAGTLTFQTGTISGIAGGPLGSSTNSLDGTVVRNGATLRFQFNSAAPVQEWLTFEGGSTFDFTPTAANSLLNLDGVINLINANTTASFSGTNGGTATVSLNPNAGYLSGAGSLIKGTVNNGTGGTLVLNESNPEWSGGMIIQGGKVIIKSVGNPTGTGAAGSAIRLGTALVNDLSSSTSKGFTDAQLIFQMRDIVNANGGTTPTGAPDSFQINVGIPQDIIVQRPSDALPGTPSSQVKKIGVIGTGLSLDQYNLNGNLHLRDDLQFYVEDNFVNVNALEERVNFNINGHILSDGNLDPNTGYIPTFTSKLNITGRPNGSAVGAYNNLYVVVSLNNSNPGFIGNLTFGNTAGIDDLGFPISNPDANHVLRLNHDLALNASNKITLLNDVTLQVPGHNVTIGSLIDNNISGTQTQFSGGLTTGYIVSGAQAIVENGSGTPSILTINQTEDSDWRFLIRDGFLVDGGRTASLALVKTGPAIVRIINANDFSGGLTVLDGTVLVRNSGSTGSATGSGKVDVIGATFGGDNTSPIAGDLTITNSDKQGVLSPGRITPEGILLGDSLNLSKVTFQSINGGHQRADFDTYSDEAGGNNDRVFLTSLDVNAPVQLVLRLHAGEGNDTFGHLFTPGDPVTLTGEYIRLFVSFDAHIQFGPNGYFYISQPGQPFEILGDGSDIHGFYLDENNDPTSQPYTMRFSVSDLDIRLTAVPEPNVALSLIAGVGALVGLQRFRRRTRRA